MCPWCKGSERCPGLQGRRSASILAGGILLLCSALPAALCLLLGSSGQEGDGATGEGLVKGHEGGKGLEHLS